MLKMILYSFLGKYEKLLPPRLMVAFKTWYTIATIEYDSSMSIPISVPYLPG